MKDAATLVRDAGVRWVRDECNRLGAALAYYALFSLFPLLLLAMTGVGFFLGNDPGARQKMLRSIAGAASAESRALVDQALHGMEAHQAARGIGAIVGLVTLVFGASAVFSELELSLNAIWRVPTPPAKTVWESALHAIRGKAFSFVVVAGAAMALLASLVVNMALSAAANTADGVAGSLAAWRTAETFVSLGFLALLLAVVFRAVPQTNVKWRDVVGAAFVTSALLAGLKSLLGWYLVHVVNYAAYGAVGAVLGLLTWIYLASLVLFYGAELSRVYAERFGSLRNQGAGELTGSGGAFAPTRMQSPSSRRSCQASNAPMDANLVRPLALGRYPTPVQRLDALSTADAELWVKRDDLTNDVCGGNKVRKLEWLLAEARGRGARRVLTVGAAGSHHVLTTTYFGTLHGFEVEAVLVPQPRTEHVADVLRTAIAFGLRATPARSWAGAAAVLLLRIATASKDTRYVPLGGSSVLGSMAYVSAARELAAQVRAGAMPEPDICVVALGSGGTAAGLAAGFAAERMKTHVVGICVSKPAWLLRIHAALLARACARRTVERPRRLRLTADARFIGAGYGHATEEGNEATRLAANGGLVLDPTYTAKAFAAALGFVAKAEAHRVVTVLYWHTLGQHTAERTSMSTEEFAPLARLLLTTGGAIHSTPSKS
jgi:YihY family inner membrane protein